MAKSNNWLTKLSTLLFGTPEEFLAELPAPKKSAKTPKTGPNDWWKEVMSTKPGPSRIRIALSRKLTPAECEYLLSQYDRPYSSAPTKVRVSPKGLVFAESKFYDSRTLYAFFAAVFGTEFVNVFPKAVRTFRELVKFNPPPVKAKPKIEMKEVYKFEVPAIEKDGRLTPVYPKEYPYRDDTLMFTSPGVSLGTDYDTPEIR